MLCRREYVCDVARHIANVTERNRALRCAQNYAHRPWLGFCSVDDRGGPSIISLREEAICSGGMS